MISPFTSAGVSFSTVNCGDKNFKQLISFGDECINKLFAIYTIYQIIIAITVTIMTHVDERHVCMLINILKDSGSKLIF